MIGQTLGHYRIEEKLGEGGMGVVYRARDLTLNRSVAIKFLSSEFADEQRRRRFQQEAQAASALNHPHILSVYEAGAVDGQQYLVMEHVDGWTLREWAQREAPPLRQALDLALQVADALAAAHEAGIVHRDIKPENVLVAKAGYAKVADFGLAKVLERPDASGPEAATLSAGPTRPGTILGTVAYMSPEQAAGKRVDARSDVFSFGVVLYELLAGERPFAGTSDVDTLFAIVHQPPRPIAEARPDLGPDLRGVIEKALEKDPADRYQSTRDLVVDLRRAQRRGQEPSAVRMAAAPAPPPPRTRRWLAAAVAAALLIAAAIAAWRLRSSDVFWENPLANARFSRLTDFEGTEMTPAVSPDGKFVVFVSDRDGPFDAWVTQLGGGEFRNLTKGAIPELGHEIVRSVGFSADGSQVWLRVSDGKGGEDIWLVPTMGGVPRPFLARAVDAVWSPDANRIVYHEYIAGDPIFIADRNGSNPRRIFAEKPGGHCHYLAWSPSGRFVYFVRGVPRTFEDIWRIPAAGGEPEQVTRHNSWVAYPTLLDERTLVYTALSPDGSGPWLYAMDVERGAPHRVSLGVELYLSVSATPSGRQLVATVSNPSATLWAAPISGRVVEESSAAPLGLPTVNAMGPRHGPDYVLYLSSRGGAETLWKFRAGSATELWQGSEGGQIGVPGVSKDGRQICFTFRQGARGTLYCMAAEGTSLRSVAESLNVHGAVSWSPDGEWIAVAADQGSGSRVFKVPVGGGEPVQLVEETSFNPVWSPDGRFIVYSGPQVGVLLPVKAVTPDKTPVPLPELSVRVGSPSARYGFLPDGKALIAVLGEFRRQDFWLIELETGRRRRLTNLKTGYSLRSFDISPDGKSILFDRVRENSDIVLIER